jgi:hypothetical protein
MYRGQRGSFVYTPGAVATYLAVNSAAAVLDVQPNYASSSTLGNGIGSAAAGFQLNPVAGTVLANRAFNTNNIGSVVYVEVQDTAGGSFQWASLGTFQPLCVGDSNGGANTANVGGFTVDIYAGIGQAYAAASNPGYFIGLTSTLGAINAQFSANAADAMGIILDSSAGALVSNWAWITRRGAGAAQITTFAPVVPAATGQLFAVRFQVPANSDAILLSVKQLTAPGVWSTLLTAQNLTGIGAAKGTRVGPFVGGRNFVNSGSLNGVIFHRCVGVTDQFNVGSAF